MTDQISSSMRGVGGQQSKTNLQKKAPGSPDFDLVPQGGSPISQKGSQFRGNLSDSVQISREALDASRQLRAQREAGEGG